MRTRDFSFPNGGHSVRKLVHELEQLGELLISIEIEENNYSWDMHFTSDTKYPIFRADLLAKKLLTLGTRFQCDINGNLTFKTKWSDLKEYPEAYGLIWNFYYNSYNLIKMYDCNYYAFSL